jgi:hypothetical protein
MTANELIETLNQRDYDPDVERAVAQAGSYRPITWADGKWRLGGFITAFQQEWDILRAVDPSLAVGLPQQCLDPTQIAGFFGIPVEEFDWPGDGPLARIESKVDTLLKRGVSSSQADRASEPIGSAQAPQAVVAIRREGTDWHLRFQKGDIKEEHPFPDLLGFQCWEVLLNNPGRRFDPEDLERMSKLPTPRRPRQLYLASSGRVDADADSGEVMVEADDDGESVGFSLTTEDDIADQRTISDLDREIEKLAKELAATTNPERREEIEQQIRNNKTWRGKLVNKKGKPRPLTTPGKEAARKRVRNLLDRARAEIGKKMPMLGRYLAVTETALEYDPARAV